MSAHGIAGKVVIVGGGAKNLGGLISRDLAQHGAKAIVVHYNSNATKAAAEETVAAVKAAGADALAVQGDLSIAANNTKLFETAVKTFGGADIAINTVGKVLRKPIVDTTEEEFDSMFDINAKAAR